MEHQALAQLLGNYGEFVGAIAVVVTLVFLSVQVKQNRIALTAATAQRRAEALNQFTQSISDWTMTVFSDSELSDLVLRGRRGELTDTLESGRFQEVASQFFVRNRSVYAFALASGNDEQAEMTVIGTAFNISQHPGMKVVWEQQQRYLAKLVVPEFVTAVDARVETTAVAVAD